MGNAVAVLVMVLAMVVGFGDVAKAETASRAAETLAHIEDVGVTIGGIYVQVEYIPCLLADDAIWFEDGSAIC